MTETLAIFIPVVSMLVGVWMGRRFERFGRERELDACMLLRAEDDSP